MCLYQIAVANKQEELERISGFVESVAREQDLPVKLAFELNLILEEYFVNLVSYAYPKGKEDLISVDIAVDETKKRLVITITDHGGAFDITGYDEKPDSITPVKERKLGGWGIELIKNLVDDIRYDTGDGENRLTLIKKV